MKGSHASEFPQPIRIAAAYKPKINRTRYCLQPYGATPFGRHALKRGNMTLCEEFGPRERSTLLRERIAATVGLFPQHVVYGRKFVSNWVSGRAVVLRGTHAGMLSDPITAAPTLYGKYDPEAIEILRSAEQLHKGYAVLALTVVSRGLARFHCFHDSKSLSVEAAFDEDEWELGECRPMVARGGLDVYICNQGFSDAHVWAGRKVTGDEIEAWQTRSYSYEPNSMVELSCIHIEKQCIEMFPSYSFIDYTEDEELPTMYVVRTKATRRKPLTRQRAKAEIIANAMREGWWLSNILGINLRAHLVGNTGAHTVWPGAVLGQRCYGGLEPDYSEGPAGRSRCRDVVVIGGVVSDDTLDDVAVSVFARSCLAITPQGCVNVGKIISVDPSEEVVQAFRALNSQQRHSHEGLHSQYYVDPRHPTSEVPYKEMSYSHAKRIVCGRPEADDIAW
jgi:hypothetical protein